MNFSEAQAFLHNRSDGGVDSFEASFYQTQTAKIYPIETTSGWIVHLFKMYHYQRLFSKVTGHTGQLTCLYTHWIQLNTRSGKAESSWPEYFSKWTKPFVSSQIPISIANMLEDIGHRGKYGIMNNQSSNILCHLEKFDKCTKYAARLCLSELSAYSFKKVNQIHFLRDFN